MDMRDHHLVAPFGWLVAQPGGNLAELEARMERLRGELERTIRCVFEPAAGFRVQARCDGDDWTATVNRHDFVAQLNVAVERTTHGNIRAVRVYGTGGSGRLPVLTVMASRIQQRFKRGGIVGGVLMFGALGWLSIGVYNPVFVLGGLLMVVVMLMTVVGGAGIGGWLADRVVEARLARLRAEVASDPQFQADLKRWRALARQLSPLRASLSGHRRHQPFRDAAGPVTSVFSASS